MFSEPQNTKSKRFKFVKTIIPFMATSSFLSKPSNRNLLSSSFHGLKLSSAFKTQSFSSPSSSSSAPKISASYDLSSLCFRPIKESIVSREMTRRYMTDMITYADSDVVSDGGSTGSASFSCAYELSKNPDINISIIEQYVSLGGSTWLDDQLFSVMVVRDPVHLFLDELEVPYDKQEDYVVIKHAALFTSNIMSKLLMWPNVKLFNVMVAKDLIIKNRRIRGVMTNWVLVSMSHGTQSCMDPNVMEAKVMVSSCRHA